ncbi:MAG: ATP-binding protein [Thermodesulfobacteriota bacterium]
MSHHVPGYGAKRILFRIILPFALLFSIATVTFWLLSSYLIGRYLQDDLRQQMVRVAGVISQSGYVLNPLILLQMKEVINAEIILFDEQGRIVNSTIAGGTVDAVARELANGFRAGNGGEPIIEFQGLRYKTITQSLTIAGRGQAFLCLWKPVEEADQLRSRIFVTTGWLALVGILAMTLAGYLIVRTITLPVEELVGVTGRIAENDFSQRAVVRSNDEIGLLARSFNRMIDQLQDYEKRLVESEKMATAGRMAAGLAHEIRNPLTSIKMFVQVLHGRLQGQRDNQQMIASLLQEIERLERIIEQIVERARPGELHRRRGNINEQLAELLALAAPSLQAGNIRLESRLSDALPELSYDPEKMKQVFWNLLNNSREAMPKGGMIEISSAPLPDGVEITFADSGLGIQDGNVDLCFKSFYSTKPEGLGLGLSTSRKIVEKHGGTLELANRARGGAVATIHLPVEKGSHEQHSGD